MEGAYSEIKDYIQEIEACRNQEEFAFILIIAQTDVLDGFLSIIQKLESKMMRLKRLLKK